METLESSRVCRLCGKHSGISINIFDKNESHVRKINAVLPIMVHEMDLLPKHMCHRCSYKLEEFHKFYVDCLKTDADLKSQLSWMRKEDSKERIGVPMVHIENVKIKVEPPEYDVYELEPLVENVNYINSMSTVSFPVNGVQANSLDGMTYATYARCRCYREKEQGGNKLNKPLTRNHRTSSASSPQSDGTVKNFEMPATDVPATRSSSSRTLMDGHHLRAACRNLLDDFDGRAASSRTAEPNYCLKENSLEVNGKNLTNDSVSMTRNLRPRKVSVSYVSKKRCHPSPKAKKAVSKVTRSEHHVIPRIKIEKVDDTEGRSLRPRNTAINYFHGRKRTPKIVDMGQQSNAYDVKRFKVSGSSQQEEKAAACQSGRISIKREPSFDDLPDTSSRSLEISQPRDGRVHRPKKLANISSKTSSFSYEKANCSRTDNILGPLKSFGRVEKKRTSKLAIRRLDSGCLSPKFLRSRDFHLRNGKVMFDGVARRSTNKLRRDFKVVGRKAAKKQVESGGNALLNVVRGATGAKRIAAMKMIDNYIKHYCEKCSVSFPNNELFKLHACYA